MGDHTLLNIRVLFSYYAILIVLFVVVVVVYVI